MMAVLGFVLVSGLGFAGEDMEHMVPYKGSAEFEKIKSLAGNWQGTDTKDGKTIPVNTHYAVTSNGSAVVETEFAGTPGEMVTIYYDKKGKLAMTHYCAIGNRPEMDLSVSSEKSLTLDFSKDNSTIDAKADDHMHSLTIEWQGNDKIVQHWGCYHQGEKNFDTNIELSRVKE